MHDDLVAGRELDDPLEHRRVEAQRRARVDDREDRRLAVERRVVDAAGDADHLEARRCCAGGRGCRQWIGLSISVSGVVDRVAGGGPTCGGRPARPGSRDRKWTALSDLGQPQQVLVVGPVADPPAAVEVGDVRRAADGPERHPVAAELDVVRRVPGVERERRRRGPDQLGDHLRVEPDALRAGLDVGAGRRAGPRARRRRGSPSRSRTGRAARRRGSTRARRPRATSVGR